MPDTSGFTQIDSSIIHSFSYNRETKELQVKYHSGNVWSYADVPERKAKSLQYASSSGGYLMKEIVPNHEGTKKEDDGE